MTTQQKNWLDMYLAVKEVYEQHQPVFDAIVARQTAFTNLIAKIAAINSTSSAQSSNITGVAQDKAVLKQNLITVSFSNMMLVKSYAISQNNNTLKTEMDYPLSFLERLTDENIANFFQHRLDLTDAIVASLTDYGITAATITAWQDAIDDYSEAIGNPRNAETNRSTKTDNLKALFTETNSFLKNQLDPLVIPLRTSNFEVYNQYTKSRIVIDRGNPANNDDEENTLTFSGTVIDNKTGALLADAVLTFGTHTTTTNAQGEFTIDFTISAVTEYELTIEKEGYDDYVANIQFAPGVDVEQEFTMSRIVLATYQPTVSAGSTTNAGSMIVGATGLRMTLLSGTEITIGLSNDGVAIEGNTETLNIIDEPVDRTIVELGGYRAFVMAQNNTPQSVSVKIEVLG